jgi:hypothetical protein
MPRKRRFEFEPTNTTADGHYIVGKGRPPEHGKFRAGDGRQRGRKPKGTKNLATDFREEFESRVPATVGGVHKKVSRQRAIVMRLVDSAIKGQISAVDLALACHERLVAPMVERDEQANPPARNPDLARLSLDELRVMSFLTKKVEGVVEEDAEIVGVTPVYREGHHRNSS